MLVAKSHIVVHPPLIVTDLIELADRRGTLLWLADETLDERPLYRMKGEVGLWTFEELKKYFLS